MRHVSLRVRAIITDPVIPQLNGGPKLCHWCQRKTMLAGSFTALLTDELENSAKGRQRLIWRQATIDRELSEREAWWHFRMMRWSKTNGEPVCPKCGGLEHYWLEPRQLWKCKSRDCYHQFSVTSGTPFNGKKMTFQTLVKALSMLENSNDQQISECLAVGYTTARMFRFKAEAYMRGEGIPKASFAGHNGIGFSRPRTRVRAVFPDGSTKDFQSIGETKADGFRPSNVSQCIAGKKKTHKGVRWERL